MYEGLLSTDEIRLLQLTHCICPGYYAAMNGQGHVVTSHSRVEAPWLFAILHLVDGLTGFGNVEVYKKRRTDNR